MQPGVAGNFTAGEQLPFELEGGLLGREQDQWRAIRIFPQRGADFLKTTERLAAAGRAEEKSRLHTGFFTQKAGGGKQFICIKWQFWSAAGHAFLFLLAKAGLSFPSFGKSEFVEEYKK
jgi:hypothetical protein